MSLFLLAWNAANKRQKRIASPKIQYDELYFEATASQTDFSLSPYAVDVSNAVVDLMVFKNGVKMTQDQTGTTLRDFKKNSTTVVRFQLGLQANDKVTIMIPKIVLS
jgi:hypothetical protein